MAPNAETFEPEKPSAQIAGLHRLPASAVQRREHRIGIVAYYRRQDQLVAPPRGSRSTSSTQSERASGRERSRATRRLATRTRLAEARDAEEDAKLRRRRREAFALKLSRANVALLVIKALALP